MERYFSIRELNRRWNLYEEYLYEYTYQIGKDVDLLYNKFIKRKLQDILHEKFSNELIHSHEYEFAYIFDKTDTSVLQTSDCKKAHSMNPVNIVFKIDFKEKTSYYIPKSNLISISICADAINLILKNNGSIQKAKNKLRGKELKRFESDLGPIRIKGSIYHELSHWISDSIHNRHLLNKSKTDTPEYKYYEIDGLVHAIKQLKRNHIKEWNILNWEDLINYIPTISSNALNIYKDMGEKSFIEWQKNLIRRLNREKLLGDNMKNFITIRDVL
jgi:hypothetical protein